MYVVRPVISGFPEQTGQRTLSTAFDVPGPRSVAPRPPRATSTLVGHLQSQTGLIEGLDVPGSVDVDVRAVVVPVAPQRLERLDRALGVFGNLGALWIHDQVLHREHAGC